MRPAIASLTLVLLGLAAAEDVLYSSRLRRRGIDSAGHFNMSFFHVNDVHAHLDEYASSGTDCRDPSRGCYGGYARIKHTIDELRPKYDDSLWLNAGDEFQGTLFYTFYKGQKIAETINQLGFDAMTLGNHEFDGGDELLGDFIQSLKFPVVSANIVSDNAKLNKTIKPYVVFEKQQIAIIGCTTVDTPGISKPGNNTKFLDVVDTVQSTINHIKSTTNITRIAALTHIGYDEDQKLAKSTTGLYLIMGGHSHTLLGDMDKAQGKYPTIVKNKDGDEVFVVTAYRWGEYLGYIDVTFDDDGKVLAYHGAPIHMTNKTKMDDNLQAQIKSWRAPFEAFAAERVGETKVELDQTTCQQKECLLGDYMADAMLDDRKSSGGNADFALINAGGIRATIDQGEITRGEVLTSFPFGNSIVQLTLKGEDLWKILEGCVSKWSQFNDKQITSFFQVSKGIVVEYNPKNSNGTKLVSVKIGESDLDKSKEYHVVTLDFLAGGGDNIFVATKDFIALDTQDEVLTRYIAKTTPVDIKLEGRIKEVDGSAPSGSGGSSGAGSADKPGTAGMLSPPVWVAVLGAVVAAVEWL